MTATVRSRAEQFRDLIMLSVVLFWLIYGGAAVVQLVLTGAKVLESLPPFWFWGIPLGPYTALYAPWKAPGSTSPAVDPAPTPPEPPAPPEVPR